MAKMKLRKEKPEINRKSIRICAISTVPLTMTFFWMEQLDFLGRNGFNVAVVCDSGLEHPFVGDTISYLPVPMKRDYALVSTFCSLIRLYRLLKREQFDIIQYATPKASLLSSLTGFAARVPVRLYCQWGIMYASATGWKRSVLKLLEWITCKLSTHVSPDSYGNLEFAISEGLYPREKGSVVHNGSANGLDLRRFNVACRGQWREAVRREWAIPADAPVFGFIGRVTREKGIRELVLAYLAVLERVSDSFLLIVGVLDDHADLDADVLDLLRSHERIRYAGHQNHPEYYIAAVDIMVLPSYREGFGNVAIEAQAMGVPVISTDIPGPQEAIVNGETGMLVQPHDQRGLEEAMIRLIGDGLLLREMGERGIRYVTGKYEQSEFWKALLLHRRGLYKR